MKATDILDGIPLELLSFSEGRRELTKYDPMLFALVYLPHHLQNAQGEITLSEFHVDLAEYGKSWIHKPERPKENRDAG